LANFNHKINVLESFFTISKEITENLLLKVLRSLAKGISSSRSTFKELIELGNKSRKGIGEKDSFKNALSQKKCLEIARKMVDCNDHETNSIFDCIFSVLKTLDEMYNVPGVSAKRSKNVEALHRLFSVYLI
jgi:hypothetical protein